MSSVSDRSSRPATDMVAVMVLAFGGPNHVDEIEPFLKNVLCGRSVPSDLVQEVRSRYELIGGASPLLTITRAQAAGLEQCLHRKGVAADVVCAMRFWHPFIEDVLTDLEQQGMRRVQYVVMSPYCTPASTGGYDRAVRDWEGKKIRWMRLVPVTGWHESPHYHDALVQAIKRGLAAFPARHRRDVPIIFTAHSLPVARMLGDPYVEKLRAAITTITGRLGTTNHHLAFQSRGQGTDAWLQPSPEQVIESLAHAGESRVLVVPLGFVADHLETLYDLDIILKNKARAWGVQLERSPALNDNPLFIEALAEAILESLRHPIP